MANKAVQSLTLKIKGLFTSFNEFSEVPDGALLEANNIDIMQDSIAQPRRGFDKETGSYSDVADRTDALTEFESKKIAHHGTYGSADTLSYLNSGSWTSLETVSAPSGSRLRFSKANQNLYYNSSTGVRAIEAYNGTPRIAGGYKGLDITASLSASSSVWLLDNYSVAYRAVWLYRDSHDTFVFGSPSQREEIYNQSGGTKAVDLVVTVPAGVTTSWVLQIYRSESVNEVSGGVPGTPSDELQLVYEASPTAGEISAKSMTVTDIVPSSLRGATIYTAASQEGLASQNEQPPLCQDMDVFRGCTFYTNVTSKHRYNLTLIAVGGSSGLAVDDTITIGGVVYTAKATETAASGYFRSFPPSTDTFVDGDVNVGADRIDSAGHTFVDGDHVTLTTTGTLPAGLTAGITYHIVSAVAATSFKLSLTEGGAAVNISAAAGGGTHTVTYGGTPAQNIDKTARSLVRVINQYSSSTVYAYYMSMSDGLPGKILLEERGIGGASFAVISSRATCWSPTDIPTSGTASSSSNDNFQNGYFFSKENQPEAVPLVNFAQIGSRSDPILRVRSLRDAIYMFKESGEVWKITGYYPSFQADKIESSVKLIGKETLQVLNNQLFALSDQGVVIVNDSTKVISRPIEQDLRELVNQNLSLVQSVAFGMGYEADRKYYLFLPSSGADTYPTQSYVYNVFTNAWTRHTVPATCAFIDSANTFYLAAAGGNYLLKERNNYSLLDFADYLADSSIASVTDTTTLTLGPNFDLVSVGDIIYQSSSLFATVTAIDLALQTLTIDANPGFSVASCTLLKSIPVRITWVPTTMGNPAIQKQFHTALLLFKSDFLGSSTLGFSSDLSTSEERVTVEGTGIGLWGLFPWGERPWGGEQLKRPIRQWVPRSKQRASQLTVSWNHSWGYSGWLLSGLSLFAETGSENVRRN